MRGRLRRALLVVLTLTVLLVVGVATVVVASDRYLRASLADDGVIAILLLGSDTGPPFRSGDPLAGRADGFHLLFVSPERTHATFVNVPRDAYVSVPGRGRTKINACLASGPQACVATAEQHFGIDVDHYMATSFEGLRVATNRFGGVTVDVPRTLRDGGQDIAPGTHRINGEQALAFTRDRKNRPNGDFDRTAAQGTFLQAAHRQALDDGLDVARVTDIVRILQQTTATDIDPGQLLRLAYAGMQIPPENVNNVTVPGNIGTAGAASVVFLPDQATALVRDAAEDGVIGSG